MRTRLTPNMDAFYPVIVSGVFVFLASLVINLSMDAGLRFRYHSFIVYTKFSAKLIFLTP